MKIIKTENFKMSQSLPEMPQEEPQVNYPRMLGEVQGTINYVISNISYPIERLERLGDEIVKDLSELTHNGGEISEYGPYYKQQILSITKTLRDAKDKLESAANEGR